MKRSFHGTLLVILAAIAVSTATADITGFNNLDPALWKLNLRNDDVGSGPSFNSGTDTLQLTNKGGPEIRSVWYRTPQPISQFTASFVYTATNNQTGQLIGGCFVIQNNPAGDSTLSSSAFGSLGYGGIDKSVAISFELTASPSTSGQYKNGQFSGGGAFPTTPVNLYSGDPIQVALTYQNNFLQVSMTDTVTQAVYGTSYAGLDIPAIVGNGTAYVGFTAGTYSPFNSANQFFGQPHFAGVPEPSTILFLPSMLLAVAKRRR